MYCSPPPRSCQWNSALSHRSVCCCNSKQSLPIIHISYLALPSHLGSRFRAHTVEIWMMCRVKAQIHLVFYHIVQKKSKEHLKWQKVEEKLIVGCSGLQPFPSHWLSCCYATDTSRQACQCCHFLHIEMSFFTSSTIGCTDLKLWIIHKHFHMPAKGSRVVAVVIVAVICVVNWDKEGWISSVPLISEWCLHHLPIGRGKKGGIKFPLKRVLQHHQQYLNIYTVYRFFN